ncbi:23S rRNA (pseudouridine(1915)-N(3))-methyltransferase RlmH [Pseudoruegeria sp. SK021]|uniref:23S rRNA (pseudouridine(1915)-N(3))-methyltransferase RlmH n=1 Tax=Pseudoruegeria sp. SK021 TaxID=1933035 RepID=UPI000A229C4C|nr:23S rRNA (pseudouridine(1915)-N(3))-methyltransferase RlmH [Pseudoruegeria sp. SK021]OSP54453.1 23S rRNA (pseudouridine(1915)-N(3))-methyltransferase RlmH [Pseudoruegeria sp. SK021]
MKLTILAVGKMRAGPELALVDDYLTRFDRTGRALGLGPARIVEVEDRKGGGPAAEAQLLDKACPNGAVRLALDERGAQMSSPDFANLLAKWRDDGRSDLAVMIGGADGFDPAFRKGADRLLSFGPMVWPHMMVRVMLAEQLYRASSILAGAPYHRV